VNGTEFLDFPVDVDPTAELRITDADDHLRDLILQVLFTEPGERVNLPEFGCGIKRLLFAPNSDILRATTQFVISQNLRRWLGDRIDLEQVAVSSEPNDESTVQIDITYIVKDGGARQRLGVRAP
jgi:phage baseplate assembly protein W